MRSGDQSLADWQVPALLPTLPRAALQRLRRPYQQTPPPAPTLANPLVVGDNRRTDRGLALVALPNRGKA